MVDDLLPVLSDLIMNSVVYLLFLLQPGGSGPVTPIGPGKLCMAATTVDGLQEAVTYVDGMQQGSIVVDGDEESVTYLQEEN